MTLTGYPFVLDPAERHRLLTAEEHEGLCCLLARARHFGGDGDVFFLCVSACSVLVRCAPDRSGTWQLSGYAFKKQIESWIWLYLPSLLGTVLQPPAGMLRFPIDQASQADAWLERHSRALRAAALQLERDAARQMHPYSVGFTRLDPSHYHDDGIRWYRLEPPQDAQAHTPALSAAETEAVRTEPGEEIHLVPPVLTRRWHLVQGEHKLRFGALEETSDWDTFVRRVNSTLTQAGLSGSEA
ncbi:MAG TPA: hypothetical protein DDX51_05700 [Clostridiales bacterium]|nr:hypothetical protein [Clostridiales bacterium]